MPLPGFSRIMRKDSSKDAVDYRSITSSSFCVLCATYKSLCYFLMNQKYIFYCLSKKTASTKDNVSPKKSLCLHIHSPQMYRIGGWCGRSVIIGAGAWPTGLYLVFFICSRFSAVAFRFPKISHLQVHL